MSSLTAIHLCLSKIVRYKCNKFVTKVRKMAWTASLSRLHVTVKLSLKFYRATWQEKWISAHASTNSFSRPQECIIFLENWKTIFYLVNNSSSETQGQLVGAGRSKSGKNRRRVQKFSSGKNAFFPLSKTFGAPPIFVRPVSTNCPWVSEDGNYCAVFIKFCV